MGKQHPKFANPKFTEIDEKEMIKIGAKRDVEGKWQLPDGRQILNKALSREVLSCVVNSEMNFT